MIKVNDHISLKAIKIKDCDKLRSLMNEIYPPVYDYLWEDKGKHYLSQIYSLDNLTSELNESESLYFFICHQSEVSGILKIKKNVREQVIHLQRIYLRSKYRGKGIGELLFNWIENTFKSDFEKLRLEVMASENKAIRFYEKMGMHFIGNSVLNFKNIKPEFNQILVYQKKI